MTPEQLEAHRVRFEYMYEDVNGSVKRSSYLKRDGETYTDYQLAKSWQAYQWALADADRAQRAAPVSEAVRKVWPDPVTRMLALEDQLPPTPTNLRVAKVTRTTPQV